MTDMQKRSISQVSRCTKKCDLLHRHVLGHEFRHGVRNEEVGELDVLPQVLPNLVLRRALDAFLKYASDGDAELSYEIV